VGSDVYWVKIEHKLVGGNEVYGNLREVGWRDENPHLSNEGFVEKVFG